MKEKIDKLTQEFHADLAALGCVFKDKDGAVTIKVPTEVQEVVTKRLKALGAAVEELYKQEKKNGGLQDGTTKGDDGVRELQHVQGDDEEGTPGGSIEE